jgi:UDP:flavonoid glycosyltransferase YjiC (YdhE family)
MYESKHIEGRGVARAEGLPGGEGRCRSRIGILSFSSPGHYYPLTALGRRLQARGHEVVYFQVADLEWPIRAAGLRFRQIGREDFPPGALRARDAEVGKLTGLAALRCGLRGIRQKSLMLLRDAPAAIREEGIDALLVDQIEPAGGTVAEHLGLPFVSVAAALPVNLDAGVPPVHFPWPHRVGLRSRLRNWVGNTTFGWTFSGVVRTINRQRRAWGLPAVGDFNGLFSGLAQVAQLPAALELPGRRLPPGFHHTGPWTDAAGRAPVDFPWEQLDPSRPLVYVSLGTLQNRILRTFRMIAEACAGLGVQVVISLGGGQEPALLGDLPGDPVVVGYAPQLELIDRSALTISHGGLNTVLESLERGVPVVVLPVTYDQPGVGARVERSGVGRSIPVGRLTVDRLREAVRLVLGDPGYRERAAWLRAGIVAANGLNRAADLIERAFGMDSRAVPSVDGRHARVG